MCPLIRISHNSEQKTTKRGFEGSLRQTFSIQQNIKEYGNKSISVINIYHEVLYSFNNFCEKFRFNNFCKKN